MAIKKTNQDAAPKTEESVFEEVSATKENEVNLEVKEEKKEEVLPLSLVERMMKEMEEKLFSKFNAQISRLKSEKGLKEQEQDIEYVHSLEDDWLDNPVVFFAFSLNFSIHGDKKRGLESLPPQGAVRFSPLIRTRRKGLRGGTQVVSVSSVKVQSKEVVDYLRGHSQYGIAFYENMVSAMNVDATWAQKMIEAQQSIGRLNDMQVIARAKQEGLTVSNSPEAMRRQLVELSAKRSIKQQEETLYGGIKNSVMDKDNRTITEKVINN